MNLLHRSGPPTREERLKACNAFGGTACDLVAGSKEGCLGSANRVFSQATGCQLMLSMAIAGTIPESVILFHGPVGCGSCLLSNAGLSKTNQASRGNTGNIGYAWFSTNLDEVEVVSGAEAKLEESLLEIDRRIHPQLIFVACTCVPAIIGDDIDGVVRRIQPQVTARILPLECAGFKTKIVATAYDVVYHAILKYLITRADESQALSTESAAERASRAARKQRTVNLLNVASMSRGDEVELTRLLNGIGLDVNVLPCFAAPDRFSRVRDVALNVSICATHDDYFVEHMKELYGIPYVLSTIPIGTRHTRKWLYEIADFFHLRAEADRLIAAEEAEVRTALEPLTENLRGKTVFVSAGEIRAGDPAGGGSGHEVAGRACASLRPLRRRPVPGPPPGAPGERGGLPALRAGEPARPTPARRLRRPHGWQRLGRQDGDPGAAHLRPQQQLHGVPGALRGRLPAPPPAEEPAVLPDTGAHGQASLSRVLVPGRSLHLHPRLGSERREGRRSGASAYRHSSRNAARSTGSVIERLNTRTASSLTRNTP